MTPMSARLDDLRQRLAALRTRFAEVAARAAAAAAAMRASAVPAEALLDDLRGTAADFDELRLAILDEASTLPRAPDSARLGTLGREGEIISAPEVAEAPVVPTARAAPVGPPVAGDVSVPGGAPVGGGMRAAGAPPSGGGNAAPTGLPVVAGDRVAPPGSPLVVEIRLAGERVQVETPQERREREELLERMAEETAQWWVGARRGWESLAQRGLPPAEAAREALARFPYLLPVPRARSDEFEDGRLAEGYAILLQRFEKEESGFGRGGLLALHPQFAARARDETYALGHELYLYIVAEGRLYKTYPDFLKDVPA